MKKSTIRRFSSAALALFFVSAVTGLTGCQNASLKNQSSDPIQRTDFLLNTFVDIKIYDSQNTALLDDAIEICKDLESRFSRTMTSSELYLMNHRSEDEQTFHISEETAKLLDIALNYCEISDGAFDITVEPVSSLWNFTSGEAVIPDSNDISDAVTRVGYENLLLEGETLTFLSPETTIDLGAIAKGYIADQIKEHLESSGVESAIINLGGNVLCIGERPDETPFKIGLQKPFAETSETFATLAINDMSVVTSGVYERHFEIDGKNYHHILDPSTGYPYENGLISVTILSERSVDGDGLSTTCFSMGLEDGLALLDSMDGVYGCFIDEEYNIYYSEGMEDFLLQQ